MASEEAGGKMKNKRPNESGKPYSRRKSIVGRVTDAMKDMISPSWLVDLVSTIKKKTPPLPGSSSQQNQQELETSHIQHRYQTIESHHDPIIRPGMTPPQPVFPPSIPQMAPIGNNAMGPHPIHQMPTPAGLPAVSGPVPFTSDNLNYIQQKRMDAQQQNIMVNGAADQSELSDISVSTTGCSSMIPHPDRKEYQNEVLQMNESRIKELRQDLGGSVTPSKELEAKSGADTNVSTSKEEKSFLWSSETRQEPRRSQPQPPAKRHKPSFNVSLFGNQEASNVSREDIHKSPFYPGKTQFGGAASAYRRGRLKESPRPMAPTRKQVTAKPMASSGGSAVTSSAAKRILDALDRMSSPLNDVKKIPSYNSNYANSPLSFTPSSYRRRESARRIPEGPPTQQRITPSRVTIATNLQRPGTGANLLPKRTENTNATVAAKEPSAGYQAPSGKSGKMRRERGGGHYSRAVEEEEEPPPSLPTEFTLPVNNMPKFSFADGASTAASPNRASPPFTFSSPIPTTSSGATAASPVSPKSFQFSSPISVDKSKIAQPSTSSQDAPKSSPPVAAAPPTTPSLAFSFNPAAAKKKEAPSPVPAQPSPVSGGFKAASTLSSGSVMDILKGSPVSSPKPAQQIKQGSVMDILGGATSSNTTAAASSSGSSSLADLFKKPTGTWDCPTCMIQNKGDADKCPACETAKPGTSKPAPVAPAMPIVAPVSGANSLANLFKKSEGSWDCPTCMVNNKSEHSVCPACETPRPGGSGGKSEPAKPAIPQVNIPKPTGPSLTDLFKKPSGTWDCDTCMVTNKAEATKCIACEMPKPGCKATTSFTSPGGFKIGPQGGFSLPGVPTPASSDSKSTAGFGFGSSTSTTSTSAASVPAGGGFQFKTDDKDKSTAATGGFKFGAPAPKDSDVAKAKPSGGFQFGAPAAKESPADKPAGGIQFGNTSSTSTAKDQTAAKPAGGFQFGAPVSKSSDSTSESDNNNKSGFGGFKFGEIAQSKDSKPAASSEDKSKPTMALGSGLFGAASTNKPESKSDSNNSANAKSDSTSTGFSFGQAIQSSSSATKDSAAGGFSFGSVIASKPATETKPAGSADKVAPAAGSTFTMEGAAKPALGTSSAASTLNQSNPTAAFSFGSKPETSSNAAAPPTITFGSAAAKTSVPSAGFVFGAPTPAASSAPSQTPASTGVFGAGASKPNDKPAQESSGAGLFVFGGKPNSTTAPSNTSSGIFQFGGANKPEASKPAFGGALGTNNPAGTTLPAGNSSFVFGAPKPGNDSSAAPMFGQKRNEPDDSGQGPAKRGRDANTGGFGKSSSTPAFGAGSTAPAFGAGTSNQGGFGTTAAPSFQFGGNTGNNAPTGGVFQFGAGAPKTDPAPAPAANFTFGQAPAAPNGQSNPASGFNFSGSMGSTPSFQFGGAGGSQPAAPNPGAGSSFQFNAPQNNNPFNASGSSGAGKARPVRKAVRKLRK